MIYGILNGEKVEASPEIKNAKCQCCDSDLIAKCGEIKIWHFAHKTKNDCSSWWKPMTEWHKSWQEQFPKKYREVVHKDPETGEKHIADIKTDDDVIIEFQHSPISIKEIQSRENFYGKKMIWVLDGKNYNYKLINKGNSPAKKTAHEIVTQYRHLLKHKIKYLCEIFNCEPNDCIDKLTFKLNEYFDYLKSHKLSVTKNIFQTCNNFIFIDNNDGFLYYIKYKKDLKMIGYRDFNNISSNQASDVVKTIDEIISTAKELCNYDEEMMFDQFEFISMQNKLNTVRDKFSNILFTREKYFFKGSLGFLEFHTNYIGAIIIKKSDFIKKYAQ
jgi:competence CoiA-like predicted nuclease